VRDPATKPALADLSGFAAKRYAAQVKNGENPWNTIDPPGVDAATIERTPPPPHLTEPAGRRHLIATIGAPVVIQRILAHLGLPSARVGPPSPSPGAAARAGQPALPDAIL